MTDTLCDRQQPIKALEQLARSLEKEETDPLQVSVEGAVKEAMAEVVRVMKQPDLDYIGDFLGAATALIKAKADKLLPPEEDGAGEAQDAEENNTEDLISEELETELSNEALLTHLMEYRVFQDAVEELARRDAAWRLMFPRGRRIDTNAQDELQLPSDEIGLPDLLSALKEILKDASSEEFSHIPQDDLFLEKAMDHIRSCIQEKTRVAFRELFVRPVTRSGVIAVFLALLELIRLKEVVVEQDRHFGEIMITLVSEGSIGELY